MIHFGLLGYPLSHSLSPVLHAAAFHSLGIAGDYLLYPIAPDSGDELDCLVGRLRQGKLQGLNVTIPYKQTILSFVDELTPSAKAIGAVNTLYIKEGKLFGHNTDAPGFLADLAKLIKNMPVSKNALVLGAGGAAHAVAYALLITGWNVTLAVRRADIGQAEALLALFGPQGNAGSMRYLLLERKDMAGILDTDTSLIVNATPVGMMPEIDSSPWPVGLPFPKNSLVYDLVYNPAQTRFVQDARSAGLIAKTGLGMLVEQAALSFACWTGLDVPRETLLRSVEG